MYFKFEYKMAKRLLFLIVGKPQTITGTAVGNSNLPPVTNSVVSGDSLLKGNSFLPKAPAKPIRQESQSKVPPASKAADTTVKYEEIIIHVWDEKKKVDKDFKCRKNILLNEMKYFEKHLKMTDSADDIDISVHWDIKIFEWLMSYLNDLNPKLEVSTVIPILISADFLIMERLIEDWVKFVVK